MLSNEQLLEQIDGSLQELTTIFDQAFQGGQVDSGWKRLERLIRRIARLIAEEVSEDEALAFQFQSGVDPFSDLGDEIDKCRNSLVALAEELRSHPEVRTRHQSGASSATASRATAGASVSWDVFICHASEDKEPFVRELAEALRVEGLKVWYDDFTLMMGDSLRRSIDRGLASSHYGLVVLSPHFFAKDWPQRELDGLTALEIAGRKVILPVWHNIDVDEVRRRSPTLADRVAAKSRDGVRAVVQDVLCVVHG
jgi:hypothetical protein